jgi:dienelactone hydrolase family protein
MTAAPAGDLIANWLTLDTADGPMRLYRVHPRAEDLVTPPAAVIVLQEAFGVNEHIQDVARRVAAQGYLAVAPDLFHRSSLDEAARKAWQETTEFLAHTLRRDGHEPS